MARRPRCNVPLTLAVLAVAAAAAAYILAIPLVEEWPRWASGTGDRLGRFSTSLETRTRAFEFLLVAWMFAVGGCFGSFLNVVVYRLPRGRSLLGSSRCPYCRDAIRPQHNVPIFGWIALRGRCRTCRLPISPRYPIVEFLAALIFAWIGSLEVLGGGGNLPLESPVSDGSQRLAWLIWSTPWPLIATAAYHAALLWTLLGWGLIQRDGLRIPPIFIALAITLGIAAAAAVPAVQPLAWTGGSEVLLGTSGAGLLMGTALGLAMDAVRCLRRTPVGWTAGTAAAGTFLGWQAALSIAAAAAMAGMVAARMVPWVRRRGWDAPALLLLAAALGQISCWRALSGVAWWPDRTASWTLAALWAGAALLGAGWSAARDPTH